MDLQRTEMVIGREHLNELRKKSVIVFGLGGVGGAACETLCRAGVGTIAYVDRDVVEETNLNRQLIATEETIGRKKTEAMTMRLKEINPEGNFIPIEGNVTREWADQFDFTPYDGILDCIDTVSAKLALYEGAKRDGVYLLSSMGTGNKLDPSKLVHTTVDHTHSDPLARVMRRECKKRGLGKTEVVYSTELPMYLGEKSRKPGSTPFVPPAAGIFMASILCRRWLGI